MPVFDKSKERFPIKHKYIFLNGCGVAPMPRAAAEKEAELARRMSEEGGLQLLDYDENLDYLHSALGRLLGTGKDNISFVKNTAEALGMIANGYPFEPGDEIVSYIHEYPSNHYPWKIQERRNVRMLLLADSDPIGDLPASRPRGWSLQELERVVTPRTRVVAVSHVQFTSGFAADLKALGAFCRERGIDLVVDAAQSLGCLPVRVEECGIAALAASGWKWLLGPVGCGVMYTSPAFRAKLEPVLAGPEMMRQGIDYLDHTWRPWHDGRCFEYSTVPYTLAAALLASCDEVFLRYQPDEIAAEVFRLQDVLLAELDPRLVRPVVFETRHRSGILSLIVENPQRLAKLLEARSIICSCRGDYLRLAPHFYIEDHEVRRAAQAVNELAGQG